jgi:hypothetical protein
MVVLDNYIKETTDNIAVIKVGIEMKGSNFRNLYTLQKDKSKLDHLEDKKQKKSL